jgi:hypothetical protein
MGQMLGQSVERVSSANPGFVLAGAPSCRGYLLKGYGLVFVVPPRRLPLHPGTVARARVGAPGRAPWPDEVVVVSRSARRDPELRELEAQVEAFQREAAQHRAEAERAFDEMTRALWTRLAEADRSTRVVVAPAPPSPELSEPPPAAPAAPPEPAVPPASAPDAPSPARPTSLPLPAAARDPLTPAPWVLWTESGLEAGDGRAPERVVADVREAVVTALETHAPLLSSLRPEESVSVVVDFVAGTPFLDEGARARRSLTLKVRKRDLDERGSGRLSAEELRRRVEAVEY